MTHIVMNYVKTAWLQMDSLELCAKCHGKDSLYRAWWLSVNGSKHGEQVEASGTLCETCNELDTETIEVYPRNCKECGEGFSEGYLISSADTYCSQKCLVDDCVKCDNCLCQEIHLDVLREIDEFWYTRGANKYLVDLQEQNKDELLVTEKVWQRFINSDLGSKYYAKCDIDYYMWTEWYCEEIEIGDKVWTKNGKEVVVKE